MQIRRNREIGQSRRTAPAAPRARHVSRLTRWLPSALLLALAVVAVLAPVGQARAGAELSPEAKAAAAAQKATEREERALARNEQRESERAAAVTDVKSRLLSSSSSQPVNITAGANTVTIGCSAVVWAFRQFPANQSNTVTEKVTFIKNGTEKTTVSKGTFTFAGASGMNTTALDAPVGAYTIDAAATWAKSPENQGKNGFDVHSKMTCEAHSGMTLEKLQKLEAPATTYTKSALTGEVGQTVDYQILVDNTGNVGLALGAFTDPHCDENTITGGPAGGLLPADTATEYLCKHVLTADDLKVGKYENTVQVTGTPTEYLTAPVTETSNTVEAAVVAVKAPEAGTGGETPTTTITTPTSPAGGAPAGSTTTDSPTGKGSTTGGKSGVLGFSTTGVSALKAPQGCVRSSFHASIKSAGVASVIFYLDGHKLKKLSARNAHKGLLAVTINPSKLKVGAHHLVADITMAATTVSPKATTAKRSLTILRCHSNVVTPKFTG